jgi:hypothetical protein
MGVSWGVQSYKRADYRSGVCPRALVVILQGVPWLQAFLRIVEGLGLGSVRPRSRPEVGLGIRVGLIPPFWESIQFYKNLQGYILWRQEDKNVHGSPG